MDDSLGQAPPPSDSVVLNLPARWETGRYLGLASGGHKWDAASGRFENAAFFPAYALLFCTLARGLVCHRKWRGCG
jgi:hypothetical protein